MRKSLAPMSVQTRNLRTSRFITYWPYVALMAVLVMMAALFHAETLGRGKILLATNLEVSEDEPEKLAPIQLKRELVGALRISVVAQIPSNQWVSYEIQLLDAQNNILATGIKQAWKESGTWYEDGESGRWVESDLQAELDVRATQDETVAIALQVLEYSDTSGREIDRPVAFSVVVQNGVVDRRYLIAGLFGTAALAVLSFIMVSYSGKRVIAKTIPDSDAGDRAMMGGSDRLVKLAVNIESDDMSPPMLQVALSIKNRTGEVVYHQLHPVRLSFKKEKGKLEKATASLRLFFILEVRSSYGFFVEVIPDGPVDKTSLYVRDGARTLGAVLAVKIPAESGT